MSSMNCEPCRRGEPLYECPICKARAHIDKKNKVTIVHIPQWKQPKQIKPFSGPVTRNYPSHFNCELAKPVMEIDLKKLVLVKKL